MVLIPPPRLVPKHFGGIEPLVIFVQTLFVDAPIWNSSAGFTCALTQSLTAYYRIDLGIERYSPIYLAVASQSRGD